VNILLEVKIPTTQQIITTKSKIIGTNKKVHLHSGYLQQQQQQQLQQQKKQKNNQATAHTIPKIRNINARIACFI
jgi:hypothetical protein